MDIRKGKYRFKRKEIWNLKDELGKVIAAGLTQFKNSNLVGYPPIFGKMEYPNNNIDGEEAQQEWRNTIDKMIYAFTYHDKDFHDMNPNEPYMEDIKLICDDNDNDLLTYQTVLKSGFNENDLKLQRERELEFEKVHYAKLKEGFELFAKYFQHLWD